MYNKVSERVLDERLSRFNRQSIQASKGKEGEF